MSLFDKIFKKETQHPAHLPNLPAEYRDDYQKHMERKGTPVTLPEPNAHDYAELHHEEVVSAIPDKKVETVDFSIFDPLAMSQPMTPIPQLLVPPLQPQGTSESVTLESLNEKINNLEKILKERGYI